MKVAIIGDSHFDETKRFDECVRIHDWIRQDAAARGCTVWLHSGDVYERKSTPAERFAVASWTQAMAESVGPGVIVRGNHDAIGDLPLLQRLDFAERSVRVVEAADVLHVGGLVVGCLAWPQRGQLLDEAAGSLGVELDAQAALQNVLRGLGASMAHGDAAAPRVLLSHAMVRGSRVSTGQPLVGCHFELGLEDLSLADADFYALGHIHMGQAWSIGNAPVAPVVYPGSPRRTDFGELESKGYIVATFEGRHLHGWTRVETPCAPMLHVDGSWVDGALVVDEPAEWEVHAAELRLRYSVPSDQREAAKAEALALRDRMLAAGALTCKVEEQVEAVLRARSPDVAAAKTPAEKLQAYWSNTGFEPGGRRESLLQKFEDTCSSAA